MLADYRLPQDEKFATKAGLEAVVGVAPGLWLRNGTERTENIAILIYLSVLPDAIACSPLQASGSSYPWPTPAGVSIF
jgi:hypothetical protein